MNIKKEKRYYIILQVFFIFLPFFFGMYYEFCGAVVTVFLTGILIFLFLSQKRIQLSLSMGLLMSGLFVIFYLITIPYAIDSGIAALGVLKILWIPLFLIAFNCSQKYKLKYFPRFHTLGFYCV